MYISGGLILYIDVSGEMLHHWPVPEWLSQLYRILKLDGADSAWAEL